MAPKDDKTREDNGPRISINQTANNSVNVTQIGHSTGNISINNKTSLSRHKVKIISDNNLAEKSAAAGEFDKAIFILNNALALAREAENTELEALVLNNLGGVYSKTKQYSKALEFFSVALELRLQIGDVQGQASTIGNLGSVYLALGQTTSALEYFESALPLFRNINDRVGEAATLNNIAALHSTLGESTTALMFYNESLPILKEIGNVSALASTLNNIGTLQRRVGNPELALVYYTEALENKKNLGDTESISAILNNMGAALYSMGRLADSIAAFEEAVKLYREIDNSSEAKRTLNNIGSIAFELGKQLVDGDSWYEGLSWLERSLEVRRQENELHLRADTIYQIARTHHLIGNLDKARTHYYDALRLYSHLDEISGEAACLTGLGRLMVKLGYVDEALAKLFLARQFYKKLSQQQRVNEIDEIVRLVHDVEGRQKHEQG